MTKKQEEIQKRRMDFYLLMAHGARKSEAVNKIAKIYHVGKQQLYRDWKKRNEWDIVEEPDKDKMIKDTLFELDELIRRNWLIIDASPDRTDSNGMLLTEEGRPMWPFKLPDMRERQRAAAELKEITFRKLQAAQSIGIVPQEPIQIDIKDPKDVAKKLKVIFPNDPAKQEEYMTTLLERSQN